jgi:hypothetical protein
MIPSDKTLNDIGFDKAVDEDDWEYVGYVIKQWGKLLSKGGPVKILHRESYYEKIRRVT